MTGWELFKRVLGSKNGKYHGIMGQLWDKCNEPLNKPWIQIASIMVASKGSRGRWRSPKWQFSMRNNHIPAIDIPFSSRCIACKI